MRSIAYRSWSTGLSAPRLVGLTSASLVVWNRSSSPTLKYCFEYRTEVYRPLRKSTVPIFDRDTDPYRFRLSIIFTDLPTLRRRGGAGGRPRPATRASGAAVPAQPFPPRPPQRPPTTAYAAAQLPHRPPRGRRAVHPQWRRRGGAPRRLGRRPAPGGLAAARGASPRRGGGCAGRGIWGGVRGGGGRARPGAAGRGQDRVRGRGEEKQKKKTSDGGGHAPRPQSPDTVGAGDGGAVAGTPTAAARRIAMVASAAARALRTRSRLFSM